MESPPPHCPVWTLSVSAQTSGLVVLDSLWEGSTLLETKISTEVHTARLTQWAGCMVWSCFGISLAIRLFHSQQRSASTPLHYKSACMDVEPPIKTSHHTTGHTHYGDEASASGLACSLRTLAEIIILEGRLGVRSGSRRWAQGAS